MAGLAVCGGSAVRGLDVLLPDAVYLQRHGDARYVLPHRIDHLANMRSLAEAGCDRVLALGSVGGLRRELVPGTFVCPDDFIALGRRAGGVRGRARTPRAGVRPRLATPGRGRLARPGRTGDRRRRRLLADARPEAGDARQRSA